MSKKVQTQSKKLYTEYSEEIQNYMYVIHKFLNKKFGNINDEWIPTLTMLADNLYIFNLCKEQIRKDGLMIVDRFNVLVKHPLIKVQNDSQIQIVKLLNEFGLTPKSVGKLKSEEENDDFLNDLING